LQTAEKVKLRAFGRKEPQRHRGHREDQDREEGRMKNEE
jgi:hypothetical protein